MQPKDWFVLQYSNATKRLVGFYNTAMQPKNLLVLQYSNATKRLVCLTIQQCNQKIGLFKNRAMQERLGLFYNTAMHPKDWLLLQYIIATKSVFGFTVQQCIHKISWYYNTAMQPKDVEEMENSANPNLAALLWSGSTLFVQTYLF